MLAGTGGAERSRGVQQDNSRAMLGTPISFGTLPGHDHPCENPVATVVMTHGIGLGEWMFEPWIETFHAWKLRVVTLTTPGHTPGEPDDRVRAVTLQTCVDGVVSVLSALPGPVVLLGHSMNGLVAQMIAARPDMQHLAGVVLLCPTPPGQILVLPDRTQLRHALPLLPVARGRAAKPSFESYVALGMNRMAEEVARAAYERCVAWPPRLALALLRRPTVDPAAITVPVLVAIGLHDRVFPWQKTRLLGDLYEGVVWRYDDLGHMPPMEPGGLRMARDIARWCAEPTRPQVIESEGFGPTEGVGHLLRRARRGELMKKRSAYGQKKAAR